MLWAYCRRNVLNVFIHKQNLCEFSDTNLEWSFIFYFFLQIKLLVSVEKHIK